MKLPKPFKDPHMAAWSGDRHYEQGWNDCLEWVLRNNNTNGPASVSPYHDKMNAATERLKLERRIDDVTFPSA